MTRREVVEAMALVSTAWTNWHLPEAKDEREVLIRAWLRVLGEMDNGSVVAAIDSFVVDAGPFPPHQGMIAKRAVELEQRASGQAMPEVDQAWAEVQAEVARVGWTGALDPRRKPLFSHPAITAAVQAMGWQALCEGDNPMADRAHFLKLYGSVALRAERQALVPGSVRELADRLGPKQLGSVP